MNVLRLTTLIACSLIPLALSSPAELTSSVE